MRLALVQLPHFYGDGLSRPPASYPLGLGYLGSVLCAAGVDVEPIDIWKSGLGAAEALRAVDYSRFDAIGVSAYATQYAYLKPFTLGLKQRCPDTPVICGGAGPTFSYREILRHTGVDVCVISEGENTLLQLLESLDRPSLVPGLAIRGGGDVVLTAGREPIGDLGSLPFPDRELFDQEAVIRAAAADRRVSGPNPALAGVERSVDIIAGRGCPYSCAFCSRTFTGVRLRPIDDIRDEITELKRRYRIDHLLFNDELVLVNEKRTMQLCEMLASLDVRWSCQGRIDQVDHEILEAMRSAGCVEVGYGIESVSQSILDRMGKRIDAARIVPVVKMTVEAGIRPVIQYMFGYPGESDETIEATARFFAEIDHPFVGFTTTPIPGSKLYHECVDGGMIADEEDYLLRLDSGYNLAGAPLQLTDWTRDELVRKKRILQARITHNYLKRRPATYVRYVAGFAGRRVARLGRRLARRSAT